jgi:hypothetical protein
MDYPTVRVRLGEDKATAEVDIAPKPDPETLVTLSQADEPHLDPPVQRLPSWLVDPA